jgi:hypothetical protein
MAREDLYTIISRARHGTTLYVATHEQLPLDPDPHVDQGRHDPALLAAREVLERITARQGRALTATEKIRDLHREAGSLADLVPRYLHAIDEATSARHQGAARFALGPDLAETVIRDQEWTGLRHALQRAEAAGWQAEQILTAAARPGGLDEAGSAARLLAERVTAITSAQVAAPHLHQPEPGDAARYAGLLAAIPALAQQAPDPAAAQHIPAALTITAHTPPAPGDQPAAPGTGPRSTGVTAALGAAAADRARNETAWPALTTALDRAAQAGHDPRQILATAAQTPGMRAAVSISEFLAWRINCQLAGQAAPGAQPAGHDPWPQLAWTLKAAEQHGTPAENILTTAASASTLPEVLRHAQHAAWRPPAARPAPLPWLPPAPPAPDDPAMATYIRAASDLITERARDLGDHRRLP